MTRRRAPRPLTGAVSALRAQVAPKTPLAAAEGAWSTAVGAVLAGAATPVSEHDGVLTVECESAVWAQELSLMGDEVLAKLNAELGDDTPIAALRFKTRTP